MRRHCKEFMRDDTASGKFHRRFLAAIKAVEKYNKSLTVAGNRIPERYRR